MAVSFSVKFDYLKSTYKMEYDHEKMYIRLRSDNSLVRYWGLGGGIGVRFNTSTNKYEIGNISGWEGFFNNTIDLNITEAGIKFDDSTNRIVGSDDLDGGSATKYNYGVSYETCPVYIIKDMSTGIATIKCPCDTSNCNTNPMNSHYEEN